MGLDSGLYRKSKTARAKIIAGLNNGEDGQEKIGYWRKRWEIHALFADYLNEYEDDNCTEIYLSKNDLKDILKQIPVDDDYSLTILKSAIEDTDFEQEEVYYYAWY